MKRHTSLGSLLIASALVLSATPLRATDGHFLHGVGAINSAMGGIGVALPASLLGAFYVNPAGLTQFRGSNTELGFEMFRPERSIASRAGSFSGSTTSSSQFVPIPAFGWSRELDNGMVIGVGGLGVGGFGVDYHVDPTNPILAPRPYGFGQVFSNFSLMKIIPAVAWRVNENLRLGFAANVDWASLEVDPMPIGAPAVDAGNDGIPGTADDRAYYSRATDAFGAFGAGAQIGLQYTVTPSLSLGLAYTTPQWFQQFEYGAVFEDPNLPTFNTPRTIRFNMDVPAVFAGGVAWKSGADLLLGVDAKYIDYAHTRGFKESGFANDGAVKGFGWKSIWSVGSGVQLRPTQALAFRAGYNYSSNPVPDELAMFNAAAPAIVQHHATIGAGYQFDGFGVDVAYYHAFKNTITGPMQTMGGAAPGTSVSSSLAEHSILVGFTYHAARAAR